MIIDDVPVGSAFTLYPGGGTVYIKMNYVIHHDNNQKCIDTETWDDTFLRKTDKVYGVFPVNIGDDGKFYRE